MVGSKVWGVAQYATGTAVGIDTLHPRHFRDLSEMAHKAVTLVWDVILKFTLVPRFCAMGYLNFRLFLIADNYGDLPKSHFKHLVMFRNNFLKKFSFP